MATVAQDEFNALVAGKDKPTRHPEDEANASSGSAKSSRSTSPQNEKPLKSSPRSDSAYTIPTLNPNANTGPKGVIADARAFEQAKRSRRRLSIFRSKSAGPAPGTEPDGGSHNKENEKRRGSDDRDKSHDADDDEGFMARWRQSRLHELKEHGVRAMSGDRRRPQQSSGLAGAEPERSQSRSRTKRVFGTLTSVDASGFLDAVEHVPADTTVLVLVRDDGSDANETVAECMRALAAKHATTRFVALGWEEAEMEKTGVPAILMYRAGELEKQLTPLLAEIAGGVHGIGVQSLEATLRRRQML